MDASLQQRPESGVSRSPFAHPTYLVRKKIFKLFGDAFHIYDPSGNVVFYSKMKAFKLKEDIRVWSGEDQRTELLVIQARSILDFGATYDVTDSQTGQKVGALRRKGLKSILRDEWVILGAGDQELGTIIEDSMFMALVRRFIDLPVFPQKYAGSIGGVPVCTFKQNFNPFVQKITLDFSQDAQNRFDRRLGIAAAVLLVAIEGRQQA